MPYFVYWTSGPYEGSNFTELDRLEDVLELLNKYAKSTGFGFTVINGHEVKFKPVSVVQAYEKE